MAQLKPTDDGYYVWKYLPSLALSIIFCVLFFIATAIVGWRMVKTKTWYITVFCIGGLFNVIGLAIRAYCYENTDKLISYILQSVFVLLAPSLFAASIYMVLGRVIRRVHAESYSIIRVTWLTKIFVGFDVISFLVQGGGAGLMANEDAVKTAEGIVVAGLAVQLIAFGFFIVVMYIFQRRMNANPTIEGQDPASTWRQDLNTLYMGSALIVVRSIFRVVEFVMGYDSYLLENEWPLYVFDIVLMFVLMIIYIVRYPGYPSLLSKVTASRTEDKRGMRLDDMS